ncbi:hypothetical protein E2562_027321 [Oryza meyeriana var. granulata]|uniref:Uncharacterized protein n=1 Tax=Oryza meyeriana var. granulata TaxID=110450 RepID=A0A6G1C0D7_9ORYZ|nr:hypothetical protein E2562_027321 [Oryza meyeriana var. granulata]
MDLGHATWRVEGQECAEQSVWPSRARRHLRLAGGRFWCGKHEEIGACGLWRQNFELHGGRFGASRVGWWELRSAQEPGARGRGEATVGCGGGHASGAPDLE